MRHLMSGRKLNRTYSHRKAMLSNLAMSILDKERVTTTVSKAKEVRSLVERLITYSKRGGLHSIRLAARTINDKTILKKLFDEIGPSYKDREGGYTRIVKIGERRGDNAEMSIIELVGRDGDEPRRRKKKKSGAKKKTQKKETQKKESPVQEAPEVVSAAEQPAETAATVEEQGPAEPEAAESAEEKQEKPAAGAPEASDADASDADEKA